MMVTNLEGVRSLRRAGAVSVKSRRHGFVQGKNYLPLLEQARQYYDTLERFRRERRRTRRYVEGDQWSELIPNVKDRFGGSMIREEDFIKQDGRVPFKQNILAQLVNNIIGQYRKNPNKSNVLARARERQKASEMLTNAVQSVLDINEASELDALNLREFVVSGFCEGKVTYEWNAARQMPEVHIRNCNPNRVFFNTPLSDPRIEDELTMIGEFYDLTIDEIVSAFAKDGRQAERIRELYGQVENDFFRLSIPDNDGLKPGNMDDMDFQNPEDPGKCRVYEIWTYDMGWVTYVHDYLNGSYTRTYLSPEQVDAMNRTRIEQGVAAGIPEDQIALLDYDRKYEGTWHVRYLTPTGDCLFEADTPYAHNSHPYVLSLWPLLDGNVYGMASIPIDQQRFINRLIMLIDAVIGNSAKNLLVVPQEAVPDNMDLSDFAEAWTRVNGVIAYTARNGAVPPPSVVSAQTVNTDANMLLQLQLQLINQISGVNEAMQGLAPKSGTPSSLYAQQAENSSVNIADLMAVFGSFKKRRDSKVLKVLMQYYTEPRYLNVAGKEFGDVVDEYDPQLADSVVDAELVVATSTDTPVYRQLKDQFLMQMFQMNAIPVEVLLQNSSLQGSDVILAQLQKAREQMAQQQQQMMMAQQGAAVPAGMPAAQPVPPQQPMGGGQ